MANTKTILEELLTSQFCQLEDDIQSMGIHVLIGKTLTNVNFCVIWLTGEQKRWAGSRTSASGEQIAGAISVWRSQEVCKSMKGRCGSVPQEKPELSPPPAMKSNQEAEQSPMDLTSLFNYSAAACLTELIHSPTERHAAIYDSNTENHSCRKMKHVMTHW